MYVPCSCSSLCCRGGDLGPVQFAMLNKPFVPGSLFSVAFGLLIDQINVSFIPPPKPFVPGDNRAFSQVCSALGPLIEFFEVQKDLLQRRQSLSPAAVAAAVAVAVSIASHPSLLLLRMQASKLAGPIPPELSALLNLAVLNLSSNRLSGPIPPQLALCAYLNVIDLHSNLLSGPIPDQLGLLVRLSTFDVSYNRLEGPIPVLLANRSGMSPGLPRFNASSFVGNRDLYGYPLPPIKGRGLSVLAIVGIGLGSGLLSLVLSFTAVCIWLRVTEQAAMMAADEGKISHLMPDY
ncbi:inactive receptor kinase [Musa troglodytarum]|uniref:Inactive receptor kinase n=1 Tax=Musa troglodytarum TaxID=320322 RepID=A0A9E7JC07_9LILI|nr:inactive receptor kinase [Musa troglodytarum]